MSDTQIAVSAAILKRFAEKARDAGILSYSDPPDMVDPAARFWARLSDHNNSQAFGQIHAATIDKLAAIIMDSGPVASDLTAVALLTENVGKKPDIEAVDARLNQLLDQAIAETVKPEIANAATMTEKYTNRTLMPGCRE